MLRFHRTSLLTSPAQTLVNTVNTVGVMGKGLAAEFKKLYPSMFAEYKEVCDRGELKPGGLWLWRGADQWVLCFATKKHWRHPSKIEYIENGLREFRAHYEKLGIREISFPRLGCGNGGLEWSEVRPLMTSYLGRLPIDIYIHDYEYPLISREHEAPLWSPSVPNTFSKFWDDLTGVVSRDSGRLKTIGLGKEVFLEINGDCIRQKGAEGWIAAEEDIFRIWIMLLHSPVSRVDLPAGTEGQALVLFSLLSELPYVRPVNIADKSGRVYLAIDMKRNSEPAHKASIKSIGVA